MCIVCKTIARLELGDALNVIGEALGQPGANKKHLNTVMDGLLDDGAPPTEDPELAEAWERSRREG